MRNLVWMFNLQITVLQPNNDFPMMCIMDIIHIYLIMGGEVEALSLGRTTNGDPLMWHLYKELLFKVLL